MRPLRLLLATLAAFAGRASPGHAQTISGAVLDGASAQPLVGAEVALDPGARRVITDAAGRYSFDDVAGGAYSLRVRRIGYRPTTLDVDLPPMGHLQLSVGLVLQPILLDALPALAPQTALNHVLDGGPRVDVERYRQEQYLASDVRGLTGAEMVEAVTLAEPDLLRAVQRLPGVTTRDDFTAQLWTRGARWSETRVYFDGLPLFNPVHAAGAFSAIPPDAVGQAFFHPGARSVALGEGAAAAVELNSRAAEDTSWGGAAELSVVSAHAAVDRRFGDAGRAGLMVAARRSYVDLLSPAARALTDDSNAHVPYEFHDVATRVDVPVGARAALQATALWEEDVLGGTVSNVLKGNRGRWGNALGRLSLVTSIGTWSVRHFVGASRLATHLKLALDDTSHDVPSHEPVDNTLTYLAAGGEIVPPGGVTADGGWHAGYEIVRQALEYLGGPPTPYSRTAAIGSLYQGTDSVETGGSGLRLAGRLTFVALWGEGRWTPVPGLTAQAGARLEAGGPTRNTSGMRLAPRAMARYRPGDGRLSLTAAWGRSFQYAQTIAPTGPRIGPDLHVTDVWLLAGDSVPVVRADVVTAGAEYWIADGWLGAVNFYRRATSGVTEPDPTPGSLLTPRPPFVVGSARARGVEVSLRRMAGRVTASLAYSHARSENRAGGFTYAAPSERLHVFDGTVMVRAASRLQVGGALTAASGAPFTRFYSRLYERAPCDTIAHNCLVPGTVPESVEEPATGRAPPYATVDLVAEWTWVHRGWTLRASAQLRNAFNWRNASSYAGSITACSLPAGPGIVIPRPGVCDRFERGLRMLPLLGVRVAF